MFQKEHSFGTSLSKKFSDSVSPWALLWISFAAFACLRSPACVTPEFTEPLRYQLVSQVAREFILFDPHLLPTGSFSLSDGQGKVTEEGIRSDRFKGLVSLTMRLAGLDPCKAAPVLFREFYSAFKRADAEGHPTTPKAPTLASHLFNALEKPPLASQAYPWQEFEIDCEAVMLKKFEPLRRNYSGWENVYTAPCRSESTLGAQKVLKDGVLQFRKEIEAQERYLALTSVISKELYRQRLETERLAQEKSSLGSCEGSDEKTVMKCLAYDARFRGTLTNQLVATLQLIAALGYSPDPLNSKMVSELWFPATSASGQTAPKLAPLEQRRNGLLGKLFVHLDRLIALYRKQSLNRIHGVLPE